MSRDHLGQFNVSADLQFARGVQLLEDCGGTCTWTVTGTDANVAATFETAAAFMGTKGLQLETGDATPAEDDSLTAAKGMGFPESGLMVVRLRLASADWTKVKTFAVWMRLYDGTTYYRGALWFTPATGVVELWKTGPALEVMTAMANTPDNLAFVTVEVVVDVLAMKYMTAMMNGLRSDASTLALDNQGANTTRGMAVDLNVVAAGAASAGVYVDSVYVGEFLNV